MRMELGWSSLFTQEVARPGMERGFPFSLSRHEWWAGDNIKQGTSCSLARSRWVTQCGSLPWMGHRWFALDGAEQLTNIISLNRHDHPVKLPLSLSHSHK